jgi:sugar lactone lactonase YvrE
MFKISVFVLVLTFVCPVFSALPDGYLMETVAEYSSDGIGFPTDLVIGPDGVIYVTQYGDEAGKYLNGSITRITGDKVETRWVDNLKKPRSIIWTGGSDAFGNNYYVMEAESRIMSRLSSNGTMSPVTTRIYHGPYSIDIDRNGYFGGDILCTTRGTKCILRIKPDGKLSELTSWPPQSPAGSGIVEGSISPTSRYSGNLFVVYKDIKVKIRDGLKLSSLYQIDADATVTQFAPSLDYACGIEFDTSGLMFNNDLFAISLKKGVQGMHLWRVDEAGKAEVFMRVGWGVINHLAFGPDGAMYLTKYTAEKTSILRVSLAPPVSVDITPGNCFNYLDAAGKGVLSVAIVGGKKIDVTKVDITTIKLQGVSPIRSNFSDVSSPATADQCCRVPDGIKDLTLKFDQQEIIAAVKKLKDARNKTEVSLTLTCKLMDNETELEGTDVVRIQKADGSPKTRKTRKPKRAKKLKSKKRQKSAEAESTEIGQYFNTPLKNGSQSQPAIVLP